MRIKPFPNCFGAEISDINLSASWIAEPEVVNKLKNALVEFKVLRIDNQNLTPDALASVGSIFGDFADDPFIEPISGSDKVIEVKRGKYETTPIFGCDWHSDWSFQSEPPKFTFLYGHIVPPKGGRTLFVDCARAYQNMPEVLRNKVARLDAIHSARRAYGPSGLFAKDDATRSMKIKVSSIAEKTVSHPVVRYIGELGARAIFINPVYTVGFSGLEGKDSAGLLGCLFKHIIDKSSRLPITWFKGTLLIWDNRTVIHSAEGGYEGYERVMFRTTIGRERPRR